MNASSTHDHLTDWLRDAHAMEQKSAELLEKQVARLERYPAMRARVEQHLEETRRQADRLEGCLARYGGGPSAMKDLTGTLAGNFGAIVNAAAGDEVVKNAIGNATVERFEIASYRALVVAAEAAGDQETARVCREILAEEEAMAAWADEQLPRVVQEFLQLDARDEPAKR
jgi:ferritin-like metal-binding protein YciE